MLSRTTCGRTFHEAQVLLSCYLMLCQLFTQQYLQQAIVLLTIGNQLFSHVPWTIHEPFPLDKYLWTYAGKQVVLVTMWLLNRNIIFTITWPISFHARLKLLTLPYHIFLTDSVISVLLKNPTVNAHLFKQLNMLSTTSGLSVQPSSGKCVAMRTSRSAKLNNLTDVLCKSFSFHTYNCVMYSGLLISLHIFTSLRQFILENLFQSAFISNRIRRYCEQVFHTFGQVDRYFVVMVRCS